jgi:hypothetical protein
MARVTIHLARAADLPPVCACCGEPATRVRRQEFRLGEGVSAAVLAASAALGGLAWTERSVALRLPVCEAHRRRGRRSARTLLWGTALAAGLGAGAYLRGEFDGPGDNYLTVAALAALAGTLVVGMHQVNDGLAARAPARGSLTLTGVHRKFAAAAGRPPGEAAGPVVAPDPRRR